jgi:hypothetical protein
VSAINAILEAATVGTLHLPVPEELRHGKVEVVAMLRPAAATPTALKAGCLKGFWIAPDFDAPLEKFKGLKATGLRV